MRTLRTFWIVISASSLLATLLAAGPARAQSPSQQSAAQMARPTRLGYVPKPAGPNPPPSPQRGLAVALPNNYGKLPLSFEPNHGQAPPEAKFIAHGPGYTMLLTADEAVLLLRSKAGAKLLSSLLPEGEPETSAEKTTTLRMKLRGANRAAGVAGDDELPGKVDYFIGNDPTKWRTNISTYGKVNIHGIYPGVDLVYYGNQQQLEYDFVVAPGADPNKIRLDVQGARNLRIDEKGDLLLRTSGGEIRLQKPTMYQYKWAVDDDDPRFEREAAKRYVDGHFKIRGKNEIVFVAGNYDHSKALTIDPPLVYSTYLGGSANDVGVGIAVDGAGNTYVTGGTLSTDFPKTSGAGTWQSGYGGTGPNCSDTTTLACGDAFVTEINPSGTGLVFSAYLGGSDSDFGTAIAVDGNGNVFVAGSTQSANFPTLSPFQSYGGGSCHNATRPCADAFVTEINPGGASLVFSTFLGGSNDDYAFGLAVDSSDNVFVAGTTYSTNFPTTSNAVSQVLDNVDGATVTNCTSTTGAPKNCSDAFVAELSFSDGLSLVYGTYLGGSNSDLGYGIALDSSDNIYVVGATNSSTFPGVTSSSLQPTFGGGSGPNCVSKFICGDGFVTELAPLTGDGNTPIVFSTYLGGSGDDAATAVALDIYADVFIAGVTDSADFPTTFGSLQSTFGGGSTSCANRLFTCGDAFMTWFSAGGTGLYYSSYLGGSGDDGVFKGAGVDLAGNAYVAGTTNSANFPTTSPVQSTYGGGSASCDASNVPCGDGFVTEVNANVPSYVFSTYLGGSGDDGVLGLAVDSSANIYVTGYTGSANFPTSAGAYQTKCGTDGNCNGLSDAFVAKFGIPTFTGPYQLGEVFVSGGNGVVYVFKQDGTLLGSIATGQSLDAGMAFDQTGNLYVTTFTGLEDTTPVGVVEFDQNAKLKGAFGNFPSSAIGTAFPESVLFNKAGDAFVGAATANYDLSCPTTTSGPVQAFEFGPSGTLLNTITVAGQCRGTDWVELLPDQKTLLYTSEGTSVLSFNISTNAQNPDFADGLPGSSGYAFRVLPNGNILVADSATVVEINPSGDQIQSYTPNPSGSALFALNLDPDGTSFWTADLPTGNVFKFDIASGNQLAFFTSPSNEASGVAIFGEKTVGNNNLMVTLGGTGSGKVTSAPAGINCPSVCLAPFPDNSSVTLTATAASGSSFAGFSANCVPPVPQTNPPTCTVPIGTADVTVTTTFNLGTSFTLTVTAAGTGTGKVTSSPAGINCPATACSASFASGSTVTLTATANTGSTFAGWSGPAGAGCPGTGTCTVTMSAAESVTATFNTTTNFTLSVTEAGTGTGTVMSSPAGINCPATACSTSFASGSTVTLTATANTGSTFAGWSGPAGAGCPGTGTCAVTMSAAESVTATFNTTTNFTLTVTEAGTGTGKVASSPAGINCPTTTCSASFASGTMVTLTATANSGSTFAGWSGPAGAGCPGTGTCTVTMSAAESVTATFNTTTNFTLSVTEAGTGTGTVMSSPAGINCPATACSASFTSGSVVTLTATAGSGSTFAGWSGPAGAGCPGTGTCAVTMSAAEAVTATFNKTATTFALAVNEAGTGAGTVTSSPAGISCPATSCSANYASGTVVTLTATASDGSTFAGWSGAGCSGTGTCVVTMNAAQNVTATFNSNSPVTIGIAPGGSSTGTTSPGGNVAFGLQLNSTTGFTGKVTLSCTSISPDITCVIVPSTVTLTGVATQVAIVVTTYCKGSAPGWQPIPGGFGGGLTLMLAALSFAGAAWSFRRRPRWVLSFGVLALMAVGLSACSNLAKSPGGEATPPGTYPLTVTVTTPSGATSSINLTLKVN